MSPKVFGGAAISAARDGATGTGGGRGREDVEGDATSFGRPQEGELLEDVDDDDVGKECRVDEGALALDALHHVEEERRVFGPGVLAGDDQMAQRLVVVDALGGRVELLDMASGLEIPSPHNRCNVVCVLVRASLSLPHAPSLPTGDKYARLQRGDDHLHTIGD